MTTHLSPVQITNYVERSLSRPELARVNEHLYSCGTCYQQFLTIFQTQRRFPIEIDLDDLAGLKGWHLQGEELKDYVADRMNSLDRDYAKLHLQDCAWCREEVENYLEFADKLEYYLSKRHSPIKQPGFWNRYYPDFRLPISWNPLRLAGVAALVLLLLSSAAVLWFVLNTSQQGQKATVSEQSQKDGQLQSPTPSDTSGHAEPSSTAMASKSDEGLDSMPKARESNLPPPDNSLLLNKKKVANDRQETETTLIAQDLVMPPIIERFDRSSVVLRGDDNKIESFNIIGPYSTVIGEDQPTFRWTSLTGAASYTVSVYDANLNLIRTSEPLTELHWTMPSHLERGVVYTWVVTAQKDGKEILAPTLPARAEFKIIEKPALDKLNRRIVHINSAAMRGVLYAQAGLLDQAERELQMHLNLHPADEIAKKLLRTIKSWRES